MKGYNRHVKLTPSSSQRARPMLIPLDDHEALLALRDFDRREQQPGAAGAGDAGAASSPPPEAA
jgi:hypothetical protein